MLLAFAIASLSAKRLVSAEANSRAPKEDACGCIGDAVSSASLVAYPRQYFFFGIRPGVYVFYAAVDLQYDKDIQHWSFTNTQLSECTVEPGTVEDVSVIVRIFFRYLGKTFLTMLYFFFDS